MEEVTDINIQMVGNIINQRGFENQGEKCRQKGHNK